MKEPKNLPKPSSEKVGDFLAQVKKTPSRIQRESTGRLVFGMDATASRERTWDNACQIQNKMFRATDDIGAINVQLCYYRGFNEFHYSGWSSSGEELIKEWNRPAGFFGDTINSPYNYDSWEVFKYDKVVKGEGWIFIHGELVFTISNEDLN